MPNQKGNYGGQRTNRVRNAPRERSRKQSKGKQPSRSGSRPSSTSSMIPYGQIVQVADILQRNYGENAEQRRMLDRLVKYKDDDGIGLIVQHEWPVMRTEVTGHVASRYHLIKAALVEIERRQHQRGLAIRDATRKRIRSEKPEPFRRAPRPKARQRA